MYYRTNYDKTQITYTPIIKTPNTGGSLLQNSLIKYNDQKIIEKKHNFKISTETNSPTSDSGATSLPPINDTFMYIETSSDKHGGMCFVVLNEQMLFVSLISHSIITNFNFN